MNQLCSGTDCGSKTGAVRPCIRCPQVACEKGRGLCAVCFVACSVVVCGLVVKPVVHKLEKVYCIALFELS